MKVYTDKKCVICGIIFSRKDSLKRHCQSFHREKKFVKTNFFTTAGTDYECSECDFKTPRKDTLQRHISQIHNVPSIEGKQFECNDCRAHFKSKTALISHLKRCHLRVSLQRLHNDSKECALCHWASSTRSAVLRHYELHHDVQFAQQDLSFTTYKEFLMWKKATENATNTRYIITKKHKLKKYEKTVFLCHRSGIPRTLSSDARKNHLKVKGSKKLNCVCPAEIILHLDSTNSTCKVFYRSSHLGHDPTVTRDEIGYLNLREEERLEIAGKISSGIPHRRILDDFHNDILLSDCFNTNLRRNDLLTNQDLLAIEKTYCVNSREAAPRLFSSDPENVEVWIKKNAEAVLYFKNQDEPPKEFPLLNEKDIVIIIMFQCQRILLKKFGHDVVAMDGTHGLNQYNFLLQTLLVLDYDGEGLPVAFCISNRNDEVVIDVFLSCIKTVVGTVSPQTFITDMQETYYTSWIKTMNIPEFRLFCTWHVRQAWRKNMRKIKSTTKQKIVMKRLYTISSEADVSKFEEQFKLLLLEEDDDLIEFQNYLATEYLSKARCWAYCYRQFAGVNTNTHLEAFHRIVKYIHGKGRKVKSLYSGLQIVRNFMLSKVSDLNVKIVRGKVPEKLKILRIAHMKAKNFIEKSEKPIQVEKVQEGWIVQSFQKTVLPDENLPPNQNVNKVATAHPEDSCSDEEAADAEAEQMYTNLTQEMYIIRKRRNICPAESDSDYGKCNLYCNDCGVCAHLFSCTCVECAVKNNMCKHIHAIFILKEKNPRNPIDETDHSWIPHAACEEELTPESTFNAEPDCSINPENDSNIVLMTSELENKIDAAPADDNLNEGKKRVMEQFQSILNKVHTSKQLLTVERTMKSLLPLIINESIVTPSSTFSTASEVSEKWKGKSSMKQKRIFVSTKKKNLKMQKNNTSRKYY